MEKFSIFSRSWKMRTLSSAHFLNLLRSIEVFPKLKMFFVVEPNEDGSTHEVSSWQHFDLLSHLLFLLSTSDSKKRVFISMTVTNNISFFSFYCVSSINCSLTFNNFRLFFSFVLSFAVTPPPNVPCPAGMFRCREGTCIPSLWVCNYQKDCMYGEDEFQSCRKYFL